ncbi:unnamed protein product [Prorocentrum cordatum]|uniref:Uncharacterized protein n=1 Tax=Prorocentrum cordatum TaxID=2364126 RepID=A0ABN9XVT3_9DINO|nr:unnamed protein product [Polarella glacialis]
MPDLRPGAGECWPLSVLLGSSAQAPAGAQAPAQAPARSRELRPQAMGRPPWVPQTMDQNEKLVGARVPPHFLSLCFFPPCAISGYERGDPTAGIFEGTALTALILHLCCGLGWCVSLFAWQPDPNNIQGDGTQRTVENDCLAGWFLGFHTIAFWETGDFCCTPDDQCTWGSGEALQALVARVLPTLCGCPPLDLCYVMCAWQPKQANFARSTRNHGGGAPGTGGMPVQASGPYLRLQEVQPVLYPLMQGQLVAAAAPSAPPLAVAPGQVVFEPEQPEPAQGQVANRADETPQGTNGGAGGDDGQ